MLKNLNKKDENLSRFNMLKHFICLVLISTLLLNTVQAFVKPSGVAGSVSTDLVEIRDFASKVSTPYKEFEYSYIDASEINIPHIKLDSEDAKKVNSELDEIEKKFVEEYEKCIENDWGPLGSINYEVYKDDDFLSINVEIVNLTAGYVNEYRAYTFSLPEGILLTDEDLLKEFGVDDNIESIFEENIIRETKHYKNFENNMDFNKSIFKSLSLLYRWDNKRVGNSFYIDKTGKPAMLCTVATMAGSGFMHIKKPLDILNQLSKDELNPIFIKIANHLDIDPYAAKENGLIYYLGRSNPDEELQDSLKNLKAITDLYLLFPDILTRLKLDNDYLLRGDEIYLLVPKYKNTVIGLKGFDEQGNPSESDTFENFATDAVLVLLNYENKNNAEIQFIYRDDIFKFKPLVKDGKVTGIKNLIDCSLDILNNESSEFDQYIYDYLISFPK